MHDFAHCTNLAVEALSGLTFVPKLELLCKSLSTSFLGSPKRHLSLIKFAEVVEAEGLNILQQVHTTWIFLLKPIEWIKREYKALLVKFTKDVLKKYVAKANLNCLFDVTTLFALLVVLSLLKSI